MQCHTAAGIVSTYSLYAKQYSAIRLYGGHLFPRIRASFACPYTGVTCSPVYGLHSLALIRRSLVRPYRGYIRLPLYGDHLLARIWGSLACPYMGVTCSPLYGVHSLAPIRGSFARPYMGFIRLPLYGGCLGPILERGLFGGWGVHLLRVELVHLMLML